MQKSRNKLTLLSFTGLMIALVTLTTAFLFHLPYGVHGYLHIGDAFLYLAVCFLPKPYGLTTITGSVLADLLTAPFWAPATFCVKLCAVLAFTAKEKRILSKHNLCALLPAAILTCIGYYIADGLLLGSFHAALISIPGNILQSLASSALFVLLALTLDRIRLKYYLTRLLQLH